MELCECTRINNPNAKLTPHQVRSEVWMSLIHGSRGIIHFVYQWHPKFDSSALLSNPEMLSAVTEINRKILELAPVLNSAMIEAAATVVPDDQNVPIALMVKR